MTCKLVLRKQRDLGKQNRPGDSLVLLGRWLIPEKWWLFTLDLNSVAGIDTRISATG